MILNSYGEEVLKCWYELPNYYPYAGLNAFAVMPNHIHGIIEIKSDEIQGKRRPISEIVRGFKTTSSRNINKIRTTPGIPVWQRNYWEHVIRDQEGYNRIYEYILTNPKRWQLDKENPGRSGDDDFDKWLDHL